jgi:starvation-inducible DNA-binding protein
MILYSLYKKHHWLVRGHTFYQLHPVLAMRRAGAPWRATAGVDPVLRRQRAPCGGVECSGHIADARRNQRAPQLW